MHKILLIIAMLLLSMAINAQTDIVYTMEGDTISQCKIFEITKGNMVSYNKHFKDYQVEAKAISRQGTYLKLNEIPAEFINQDENVLYRGHDFTYYEQTYQKAMKIKRQGALLTFLGLTVGTLGVFVTIDNPREIIGPLMAVGGGGMMDAGIFMWIYGGVKSANNRKAMNQCKQSTKLSFGTTSQGVGFRLKF
ncbi:MAG: hypothetical protein K9G61_04335 [Bacteroidales bacterium]|nr:hypothetical protein [Bacteroidales bacterium]